MGSAVVFIDIAKAGVVVMIMVAVSDGWTVSSAAASPTVEGGRALAVVITAVNVIGTWLTPSVAVVELGDCPVSCTWHVSLAASQLVHSEVVGLNLYRSVIKRVSNCALYVIPPKT